MMTSSPSGSGIARRHAIALLREDLHRLGPQFGKWTASIVAIVVLALATGIGTRGFITGLVTSLVVMQPMFVALQLVKDKVDGTLHFLCTLPVSAATLATVRVLPVLVLSALGGIVTAGLVLWAGVPAQLDQPAVTVVCVAGLLGALMPAALACLVLALSARYSFETLVTLPMLLLLGLAVTGKLLEAFLPAGTAARVLEFAGRPLVPGATAAALAALLLLVVLVSYRVTVSTFARFVPASR